MSAVVGDLVIVKRGQDWVNGVVKAVSADRMYLLVQLVDTQTTFSYPLYEVFLTGARGA